MPASPVPFQASAEVNEANKAVEAHIDQGVAESKKRKQEQLQRAKEQAKKKRKNTSKKNKAKQTKANTGDSVKVEPSEPSNKKPHKPKPKPRKTSKKPNKENLSPELIKKLAGESNAESMDLPDSTRRGPFRKDERIWAVDREDGEDFKVFIGTIIERVCNKPVKYAVKLDDFPDEAENGFDYPKHFLFRRYSHALDWIDELASEPGSEPPSAPEI